MIEMVLGLRRSSRYSEREIKFSFRGARNDGRKWAFRVRRNVDFNPNGPILTVFHLGDHVPRDKDLLTALIYTLDPRIEHLVLSGEQLLAASPPIRKILLSRFPIWIHDWALRYHRVARENNFISKTLISSTKYPCWTPDRSRHCVPPFPPIPAAVLHPDGRLDLSPTTRFVTPAECQKRAVGFLRELYEVRKVCMSRL